MSCSAASFPSFARSLVLLQLSMFPSTLAATFIIFPQLSSSKFRLHIQPPKMEGIDSLLAKSKGSTLNHDPELNGSAQLQTPVTAQRFNSKSSRKASHVSINEFVKRDRAATIHTDIISHLKMAMPSIMGNAKAQQRLVDNLEDEFAKVQREFHLPVGDFPDVDHFKDVLNGYGIDKFEKLKPKMIQAVDDMLAYEIPELLKKIRNPCA